MQSATEQTAPTADTLRAAIVHSEGHHPNNPCGPHCSGWAPTQAYRAFLGMTPALNPWTAKGTLRTGHNAIRRA